MIQILHVENTHSPCLVNTSPREFSMQQNVSKLLSLVHMFALGDTAHDNAKCIFCEPSSRCPSAPCTGPKTPFEIQSKPNRCRRSRGECSVRLFASRAPSSMHNRTVSSSRTSKVKVVVLCLMQSALRVSPTVRAASGHNYKAADMSPMQIRRIRSSRGT